MTCTAAGAAVASQAVVKLLSTTVTVKVSFCESVMLVVAAVMGTGVELKPVT